jgi:hypothetical protein
MGVTRGLALPTPLKHNMLLRLLIIKELLNDRPTCQKRTLILRANVERISNTLFDHSHTIMGYPRIVYTDLNSLIRKTKPAVRAFGLVAHRITSSAWKAWG